MSKIFKHPSAGTSTGGTPSAPAGAASASAPASSTSGTSTSGTPTTVDVTAILDDLAANNPEKPDWRKSIVDLMKLVGMDSSLDARKSLAAELNYPGDPGDSAQMNVWLHKQVIVKLAENGGKVPQELLDRA